jgi:hypothetical protein
LLRCLLVATLALPFLLACQDASSPLAGDIPSPSPTATAAPPPAASPTLDTDEEVILAAVGDVMLGRSVGQSIRQYGVS